MVVLGEIVERDCITLFSSPGVEATLQKVKELLVLQFSQDCAGRKREQSTALFASTVSNMDEKDTVTVVVKISRPILFLSVLTTRRGGGGGEGGGGEEGGKTRFEGKGEGGESRL